MNNTKIEGSTSSDIRLEEALDFAAHRRSISPQKVNRHIILPVNRNPQGHLYRKPQGHLYRHPQGHLYGHPHRLYEHRQILHDLPYMQHIPLIQQHPQNNKLLHYQCQQLGYTMNDNFNRYYGVNHKLNKVFVPSAPALLKRKKVLHIPSPSSPKLYPVPPPPPSSPKSYPVPPPPPSSPKSSSKKKSNITVNNHSTMTFAGASPPKKMPPKKMPPKKMPPKKMPSKKMPPKKMPSKKMPPKKMPPKKMPSKKMPSKKMPSKKMPSKKMPSKKMSSKKMLSKKMPKQSKITIL